MSPPLLYLYERGPLYVRDSTATNATTLHLSSPCVNVAHVAVVLRKQPAPRWLDGVEAELRAAFRRALAAPRMRLGRPLKGPPPRVPPPPPRPGREPVERLTAHRHCGARSLTGRGENGITPP